MIHETQNNRNAAELRSGILAAFRATFSSDSGRSVLGVLQQSVGHGKPSFLPAAGGGPLDPYAAAFRDGRKSVVDEILANLATAEDAEPTGPKSIA
jgi:hypothetical protein